MSDNSKITIFIANLSELLYQTYKDNPKRAFIQKIIQSDSDRTIFYGDHNKIIITSAPIDNHLVKEALEITEYKNVYFLCPRKPTYSLSLDTKGDKLLASKLLKILQNCDLVEIIPYGSTKEFYVFVEWLRKKLPRLNIFLPESSSESCLYIRDYIDTKAGFRETWNRVNKKVTTPEGFHCKNLEEAKQAGKYFFARKKSFLFKRNNGVSGWGIEKFVIKDYKNSQDLSLDIQKRCSDMLVWGTDTIVVEEVIDVDNNILGGSPSIEYHIQGKKDLNYKVKYEYFCEQVLNDKGNFKGIVLRSELEDNPIFKTIKMASNKFARELSRLNYIGYFDIDYVVSKNNKVYAVESNTRRTGGTHVWQLANHLIGKNDIANYLIFSNDALTIDKSFKNYSQIKSVIKDLLWQNFSKDEGVVITGTNMLIINKFGYICFAKTQKNLDYLNNALRKTLKATED